jgi:hypothetical protein
VHRNRGSPGRPANWRGCDILRGDDGKPIIGTDFTSLTCWFCCRRSADRRSDSFAQAVRKNYHGSFGRERALGRCADARSRSGLPKRRGP